MFLAPVCSSPISGGWCFEMKNAPVSTRCARLAAGCALMAMLSIASSTFAQTLIPPLDSGAVIARFSSLIEWAAADRQIQILPTSAPVGVVRRLSVRAGLVHPCFGAAYVPQELDLSTLATGVVTIKRQFRGWNNFCLGVTYALVPIIANYEFTVTTPGVVKVVFADSDFSALEATMITTATGTAAAVFDVNGMWYDTATNGAGISIHQRAGFNGPAFGTWFMFDREGNSRWYSLQGTSWSGNGDTWQGLFVESFAGCTGLSACPGKSASFLPTYNFKIRFQSATVAVAEVFGQQGEVLFRSNLRRLEQ